MVKIPVRARNRIMEGIKKYQPVVQRAKDRDINESDTVALITDILSDVLGYEKYSEITSEYAIKKTYCDLAIELNGKPVLLLEAKAAGVALKGDYVRQAVNYAANEGIEWVVLTNAVYWKIYRVMFQKPITEELVYEFCFCDLSSKREADLEMLFYLSKESTSKSANSGLNEFAAQKQIMNHFFIGQLLLTEPILSTIRRQIKKMFPDARFNEEEVVQILTQLVIKRDVFEGEKSQEAAKRIKKYEKSLLKESKKVEEMKSPSSLVLKRAMEEESEKELAKE